MIKLNLNIFKKTLIQAFFIACVFIFPFSANAAITFTAGDAQVIDPSDETTVISVMDARNPNEGFSPSTGLVSVSFTDTTALSVNQYYVTFRVRAQDGTEYTLVDFKRNNESGDYDGSYKLKVTESAGTYTARYEWNPSESQALGDYDLYAYVFDGTDTTVTDYSANLNEVALSSDGFVGFPLDVPAITAITPSVLTNIDNYGAGGTDTVAFSIDFDDFDGHLLSDFDIKITVRAPDNKSEYVIVSGTDGVSQARAGDDAAFLSVTGGPVSFNAAFTWGPETDAPEFPEGYYDFKVYIKDPDGLSYTSDFSVNTDLIGMDATGADPGFSPPTINSVSASVSPVTPGNSTVLTGNITEGTGSVVAGDCTFSVRSQNNSSIYGPYTATGYAGGNCTYTLASDGLPFGWYDVYFEVNDSNGAGAVSDYDTSREVFYVGSTIDVYSTFVDPANTTVDIAPNDGAFYNSDTYIKACFTNSDGSKTAATDYWFTIKVRGPDSAEEVLVNNVRGDNASVTYTSSDGACGGDRSVQFDWTPAGGSTEGMYDVSVSVYDGTLGNTDESTYTENSDIVQLIDNPSLPYPPYELNESPVVGSAGSASGCVNGACLPGTETAYISATFSDLENEGVGSYTVTVKLRSPDNSTEWTLVEDQGNGGSTCSDGTVSTSCSMTITDLGDGSYQFTLAWNPLDSFFDVTKYGTYDLELTVRDSFAAGGVSDYDSNLNKVSIEDTGFPPFPNEVPEVLTLYVSPTSVTLEAGTTVDIFADFYDNDNPTDTTFYSYLFKVRNEANVSYDVTCGTENTTNPSSSNFQVQCAWVPPGTLLSGTYDIYVKVTDDGGTPGITADDVTREEPFDDNQEELELLAAANLNPNIPASMTQKDSIDVVIATGGYTNDPFDLKFGASMTDQNALDDIWMEIEIEPLGTAFDGVQNIGILCFPDALHFYEEPTAVTGLISCSGFTDGTSYHWQARVKDISGGVSSAGVTWTSFDTADINTSDFTYDTTAPVVLSTDPVDLGTGSTTQDIVINFTDFSGIDPATATSANAYLRDGSAVLVSATVTVVGNVLTINPDVTLNDSETYTVYLTTGIADLAGNTFVDVNGGTEGAYDFSFTALQSNTKPNDPAGYGQFKEVTLTQVIADGGYTNQATIDDFYVKALVDDPNTVAQTLYIDVEIKPSASAFDETGLCSSAGDAYAGAPAAALTLSANCSAFAFVDGTAYKWRVRSRDQGGLTSAWFNYGAGDPDFTVDETNPTFGGVIVSSTVYTTFVDSSFNVATTFADTTSPITGCEVCVDIGASCGVAGTWIAGTWSAGTCSSANIQQATDAGAFAEGNTIYINMRSTDTAGNVGTAAEVNYTMDKNVPTGTISIEAGAARFNNNTVSLDLTCADGTGSGCDSTTAGMMLSNVATFDAGGEVWEAFNISKTWATTAGDGTKTVYIKYKDYIQNESITYSDTIYIDTVLPQVTSASASSTTFVRVDFNENIDPVTAAVTTNYAFFDPDCSSVPASAPHVVLSVNVFSDYVELTLKTSGGDNPLTDSTSYCVDVTGVQDVAGNVTDEANDTAVFLVDTAAPATISISIDAGATYATALGVTVTVTCDDAGASGCKQFYLDNDNSIAGASVYAYSVGDTNPQNQAWNMDGPDGTDTVYLWFEDNAGNITTYSNTLDVDKETIILDRVGPSISFTSFNSANFYDGGATKYTGVQSVDMTISACSDATTACDTMIVSNDTTYNETPEAVATTKNGWTLTAGDGAKNVYFRVYDLAGNFTDINGAITYDTTAPSNGVMVIGPSATQCSVDWTAAPGADAGSGIVDYKLVFTTGDGSSVTPPGDCSGSDLTPVSTATTYPHTGRVTNIWYGYRLCVVDNLGWQSAGSTGTCYTESNDTSAPGDGAGARTDLSVYASYARGLEMSWTTPSSDFDATNAPSGTALDNYEFRFVDAVEYPSTLSTLAALPVTSTIAWWDSPPAGKWWSDNSATGMNAYNENYPLEYPTPDFYTVSCNQNAGDSACSSNVGEDQLWPNTLYYVTMKVCDTAPAPGPNCGYSTVTSGTAVSGSHTGLKYGWNIISVPYDIETGDRTFTQMFGDNGMGTNDLYRVVNGSFVSVTPGSNMRTTLNSGEGFYIYSSGFTNVVDEQVTGGDVPLASGAGPIIIPLDVSNQNIIGNPWLKNVDFATDVEVCDAANCSGTNQSFADAAFAGWVSDTIYYSVGQTTTEKLVCTAGGAGCAGVASEGVWMRPWWGYFVTSNNANGAALRITKP